MQETQHNFNVIGKRTILVVEDELINRELLGLMLQDLYQIIFAENGTQAMDVLDTRSDLLSLVLLDLHLPDMDGIDILRRITSDTQTAGIPVIVLTADQNAEVDCLNLGATDFVSKPYPKREVVLARIQRTIELFEDRDIIHWTERDHLTGLFNPEFFFRHAVQFDTHHEDAHTDAIVVNINHFRMFNERYGKAAGDEVLIRIAKELQEAARQYDGIACRSGGDTFYIYCRHRSDYEELLERFCVNLGGNCQVRVRMGVYPEVDRSADIERSFDRAKLAADKVREMFDGAVGIYDKTMYEKELFSGRLLEDFHAAIKEKQFTVYYQPKFQIQGIKPILHSVEALVRWEHPELGMVSPGAFIPLFEENGLIRELDSYVWREAGAQIRSWKEELHRSIPVSINVSRVDLNDPSVLKMLSDIAEENGIEYSELRLEITESAYTENSGIIIDMINNLRNKGFLIEMDDFGSGYSSLNMLTALPIDALKLDMQFVRTAFGERKDTRLLAAVLGLAQSLGFPTIAEGVETQEQFNVLRSMGCDVVQGYYFSKPLPARGLARLIRESDV